MQIYELQTKLKESEMENLNFSKMLQSSPGYYPTYY